MSSNNDLRTATHQAQIRALANILFAEGVEPNAQVQFRRKTAESKLAGYSDPRTSIADFCASVHFCGLDQEDLTALLCFANTGPVAMPVWLAQSGQTAVPVERVDAAMAALTMLWPQDVRLAVRNRQGFVTQGLASMFLDRPWLVANVLPLGVPNELVTATIIMMMG